MVGRVVVVEDDVGLAYAIGRLIERAGYTVSVFTNPTQAWDDIKTQRPRLLIADIVFPQGPNGVALAAHARACHRHLPVIFLTGNADAARWIGSPDGDDTTLLIKPVADAVLVKRVQELAPLAA